MNIIIQRGTRDDYAALARFHYRAADPARPVLTLRAIDNDTLAGVLVITRPTLNAPWRRAAWPELFVHSRSNRTAALTLNRHVRTIARVIIDPRYRALGIARQLVSHYLANPLTTHTEAIAAMGRCCPFFSRAGMQEVTPRPTRRDTRLALTLRQLSLAPWELIELTRARSCLIASPSLRAAIRTWALDSKSTRRHLPDNPTDLDALTPFAILAASSLTARPLVYVADVARPCHVARPCSDGRGDPAESRRTITTP
jgi:GNAT superfamily N-acetyltransferase